MAEKKIVISTKVVAPLEKVWRFWTQPEHIKNWNFASNDWHCPEASNDLKVGGSFSYTMAAKDGSASFDFEGTYDGVEMLQRIAYTISDGRAVEVTFNETNGLVEVTETFEPEGMNPEEMQRGGWQAILDSFKSYVENSLSI